jgi:hypothetical protein
MKRNRIRVHLVKGYPYKNPVDLFGYTLQEVNNKMAVDNEDMTIFKSSDGREYRWTRKHVKDWEVIEEQSDGIIPGKP